MTNANHYSKLVHRLFSSSKIDSSVPESCTDGICLPLSFFELLDGAEKKKMLQIYANRNCSSTGLIVNISNTVTHFNIETNLKYSNVIKQTLVDQVK